MEKIGIENQERKFSSPEEELKYLRSEVARREEEIEKKGELADTSRIVSEKISEYKKTAPEKVLAEEYRLKPNEAEAIILDLSPEEHDKKIEELIGVLQEKGVLNVISVIEKLGDAHLNDDFHRFLVQYIKAGLPVRGLKEKSPLFKTLKMTLFEISLPEISDEGEKQKNLKEIVSSMEQFYAGMLSVYDAKNETAGYFAIELANANHSDEFIFYASVPDFKKELFEKQILSVFPNAKIYEKKDDYNIFNESGVSVGAYLKQAENPIFPIKTYEQFDYDPLNIILNSFSKIDRDGEGAAIQIVFKPAGDYYLKKYKKALEEINKGVKVKEAIDTSDSFFAQLRRFAKDFSKPSKSKKDKDEEEKPPIDQSVLENIKNKIATPIVKANVRIVASAQTRNEAEAILSDIQSSFNQFENTFGNKFKFQKLEKVKLIRMLKEFSFRVFSDDYILPLNIKEITSILHFPSSSVKSSPQLKQAKAGSAPAPVDIAKNGIVLGINKHRNMETKIYMTKEDRLRHFYTIGQTGTGKTTLLKNMIAQDIIAGEGVCMIDPHGSDIQDVLSIIPKERYEDVIYFDPSYTERPMALNMLEYDRRYPEQKTFVVNELFNIFQKLYGAIPESMGPIFEQYFRNATMLVIDDPDSGNTLLDVSRVMSNKSFRDMKLSRCKNPVVIQFWKEVAEKAGGEAALANIVPYITSKFDIFLANDIMRPIIAQEKSSFNFREIMDNKKILLVNLAKGRLGDINANLIGLILVGKILMSALSRVDSLDKDLPPFYLYIDEFQNITTNSISTILSEARKYKLSLSMAHQFIAQLEEGIKDSVFGNVGSMAVFRVGAEDAEFLEKQFAPVFTAKDLMNIDNRNAYLKMLSNGRPVRPFNIETITPSAGDKENIAKLKELSYLKFGRDRASVEEEVAKKYEK
ncbi:MAG: TraM recognition domain-containing protein [Patescibacteria group bacterium]